jgi:hypothetical protein
VRVNAGEGLVERAGAVLAEAGIAPARRPNKAKGVRHFGLTPFHKTEVTIPLITSQQP